MEQIRIYFTILYNFYSIYFISQYNEFTLNGVIEYPYNPIIKLVYVHFKISQFTFPFIITLLSAQFFLKEKQGDGFRLFQTIPVSPFTLLKIRYFILLAMIILLVLIVYFTFLCSIKSFELFSPLIAFGQYDMRLVLAVYFSRILFAACCIAIIQYGLHIITNNYYIPIIFAFIAMMFGYMPGNGEFDYYYAGGYFQNIMNEVYNYGTNYQWKYALFMLITPTIITILCVLIRTF